MEASHWGFHPASFCHMLQVYSLLIPLATALKVEVIGVKCTGSVCTGKVSSKYRPNSLGHMMRHRKSHLSMPITTSILRWVTIRATQSMLKCPSVVVALCRSVSGSCIVGMKKSGRRFFHDWRIADAIEPGLRVEASTDCIGACTVLHPNPVYYHEGINNIMCPCRLCDDSSGYWSHVQGKVPLYI